MIYASQKQGPMMAGYVRASTGNPLGWRPGTVNLGYMSSARQNGPDWKAVAAQRDAAIRAQQRHSDARYRASMARMHAVDSAARGDRTRVRVARMSGLGDPGWNCDISSGACSPCDTNDDPSCVATPASVSPDQEAQAKASIFNIGAQLQQANQKLLADENLLRQMVAAGTPASPATARGLMDLRNEFESILSKYTTAYRAAFGTTPSGFSGLRGLGLEPVSMAVIVTLVAAIGAALAIWYVHESNVSGQIQVDQQRAQTAGSLTNQATSIQQQIATAQANGDTAKVAALTAQYQQLLKLIGNSNPNPTDWGAFFQNNWGWFAAAVGGIVLVSKI